MWNHSLMAPVILSKVGKHIKYKKYALINKVSVSVFYFCRSPENLVTSLHSFVGLKCHLLSKVTRFGQISLFPYWHLLSAALYGLL